MKQAEKNPTQFHDHADNHVDYSEMYRTQEMKQLNKRLKRTRNVLLISALAIVGSAAIFWMLPGTTFTTPNFLIYTGLTLVLIGLAAYSKKHPYFSILSALLICIGVWALEMILYNADDLLIESSILKLIIVSLLISSFHASKEAELIRKELHFS